MNSIKRNLFPIFHLVIELIEKPHKYIIQFIRPNFWGTFC